MLIDTHAHYDDTRFDLDRDDLINKIRNSGYIKYIINISADISSLKDSISLSSRYDFIYSSVGIHPHCVEHMNDNIIKRMFDLSTSNPKVQAIGEIGLDYYYPNSQKELQKQWFIHQIDLAKQVKLPLIIHDRDAHKDVMDIIKREDAKKVGGVFHCYSGSVEMLREVLNNNFYISIGGVITFKNAKHIVEVVKNIPLDKLLLETDCPFLAPEPYRGKRNDSRNIKIIAQKIAEIRNMDYEHVANITTRNAQTLFNLE